ncbi:hypothetical protein HYQ46_008845 [Verticillium longisporum]|nr:hypothetical protein HYQ46_008845 [Verticillium longisporum]
MRCASDEPHSAVLEAELAHLAGQLTLPLNGLIGRVLILKGLFETLVVLLRVVFVFDNLLGHRVEAVACPDPFDNVRHLVLGGIQDGFDEDLQSGPQLGRAPSHLDFLRRHAMQAVLTHLRFCAAESAPRRGFFLFAGGAGTAVEWPLAELRAAAGWRMVT